MGGAVRCGAMLGFSASASQPANCRCKSANGRHPITTPARLPWTKHAARGQIANLALSDEIVVLRIVGIDGAEEDAIREVAASGLKQRVELPIDAVPLSPEMEYDNRMPAERVVERVSIERLRGWSPLRLHEPALSVA